MGLLLALLVLGFWLGCVVAASARSSPYFRVINAWLDIHVWYRSEWALVQSFSSWFAEWVQTDGPSSVLVMAKSWAVPAVAAGAIAIRQRK